MSTHLDTLVQRLEATLDAEGFGPSAKTADGFYAVADSLPARGHLIDLRTACWWAADALVARSDGRADEALRWTEKATYELNRATGAEGQ